MNEEQFINDFYKGNDYRKFAVLKEIYRENTQLKEKYDKALQILCKYNMPCEINNFMDKNTDYCARNCSVDDEVYKRCWNRFIEWKLKGSENK